MLGLEARIENVRRGGVDQGPVNQNTRPAGMEDEDYY